MTPGAWSAAVGTAAAAGAAAAVLCCIPGLHISAVLGLSLGILFGPALASLHPEATMAAYVGLVAGYGIAGAIPAILFSAPDETAVFVVAPARRYLVAGRAPEAVALTLLGGLSATALLAWAVVPISAIVPLLQQVFRPHAHWVVWIAIVFLLLCNRPEEDAFGVSAAERLARSWAAPAMGWATFVLSGLLGFVLFHRSPLAARVSFLNLMPALAGLFATPWLIVHVAFPALIPVRSLSPWQTPSLRDLAEGTAAGAAGGAFAAFFPAVTGGIGSLAAGHAAPLRSARVFLISQGAARSVFYSGGLMLGFMPGGQMTCGGAASLLRSWHAPDPVRDFLLVVVSATVAAAAAAAAALPLCIGLARALPRVGLRLASALALAVITLMVFAATGTAGVGVLIAASAIGLIPVLHGAAQMNGLGLILLPMACNLSGFGPAVARWLGIG